MLKDEVVPQAVRLFALDPDNNGCDAELDSDEETLDSDDIGSDTSEGEEEEEDDSGSESDEEQGQPAPANPHVVVAPVLVRTPVSSPSSSPASCCY